MTVSFQSNWAGSDPAAGWGDLQIGPKAHLAFDPAAKTSTGKPSAKVVVPPGAQLYSSDGERSEVALMGQGDAGMEPPDGAVMYYGFAHMLPAGWAGETIRGDQLSWSLVAQLHGPDELSASPSLGLACSMDRTGGTPSWWLAYQGGQLGSGGQRMPFAQKATFRPGVWRYTVFLVSRTKDTHSVLVYARDEDDADWSIALRFLGTPLQWRSGQPAGPHYWKTGLYRGKNVRGRTDTLWIGDSVRASSLSDVETALGL